MTRHAERVRRLAPAAGAWAGARIPFDMEPGDTAGLTLTVTAPDTPGEYVLELGLVQEGMAWPEARAPGRLSAPVKVLPAGGGAG